MVMIKLHQLGFKLFPHPSYSPNLAPSDYPELKRRLQGKKFASNDEVIHETNVYFEEFTKKAWKCRKIIG